MLLYLYRANAQRTLIIYKTRRDVLYQASANCYFPPVFLGQEGRVIEEEEEKDIMRRLYSAAHNTALSLPHPTQN